MVHPFHFPIVSKQIQLKFRATKHALQLTLSASPKVKICNKGMYNRSSNWISFVYLFEKFLNSFDMTLWMVKILVMLLL